MGVVVFAATMLAACGDNLPQPQPITVSDRGQGFELVLHLPKDRFASSEGIDIDSTLLWTGPAPQQTVWSGDPGPTVYVISQVDGPLSVGGVVATICAPDTFERGTPAHQPYVKSAGFSDDDPNAGFYRAFSADPLLHLPPGNWRIRAEVDGFLAECAFDAPRLTLRAEAHIVVE